MSKFATNSAALQRDYLPVRAKILEIAASLDRIERASEQTRDDPRWAQLQDAIEILQRRQGDRAETVQLLFSRPYDPSWREQLGKAD